MSLNLSDVVNHPSYLVFFRITAQPPINHAQLISSVAAGDRDAFRALYEQFAGRVYNTALSYLQDKQDAEEVTQDVFVTIYRQAGSFRGDSALSTWIYRIAANAAINYRRKRRKFTVFSIEDKEAQSGLTDFRHPGVQLEHSEQAAHLFKAVEALPDKQKMAFVLSYVENLPRQEVADVMEMSLKAVESLLMRAKSTLRKKLEKMRQA